jgi:hypothetical protein
MQGAANPILTPEYPSAAPMFLELYYPFHFSPPTFTMDSILSTSLFFPLIADI